jgi:GTP-binding protein
MRTSLLIHLIDGSQIDPDDPLKDWRIVNDELALFDPALAQKPQIVVINKIDLAEAREHARAFGKEIPERYRPLYLISAATTEGVQALVQTVGREIQALRQTEPPHESAGI